MRLKNKKIVILILALNLIATTSGVLAGDVILHPGYIEGSLNLTDLDTYGETLIGGTVDAFSLTDNYDGHDYNVQGGIYSVTVEGGYDYKVFSEATIKADFSSYWYQSSVSLGRKDTYVEVGETVEFFDFEMVPGRIAPIVTVTGGEIQKMGFYVRTDLELPPMEYYTATHNIFGKNNFLNGDESTFPMRPWVSHDANGDGDYYDQSEGDTYVMINGWVYVDDIQYYLPAQFINVFVSDITVVEWSLDVSSSIYGNVIVQGEPISYYQLYGGAWIDGDYVSFNKIIRPASEGHDINLLPATWGIRPTAYWRYGTNIYNILIIPSKTETLGIGERKEVSWNINPGIVTGSVSLFGAYGNLDQIEVYGGGRGYSVAHTIGSDYRLILYGGEWRIGYPYTILDFLYDNSGIQSDLLVTDYGTPTMSVEPGTEINGIDLSYDTATITVYYRVELPGGWGELRSPYLIATASEGTGSERIDSRARGWGSNEFTTLGECTITVLAGTYNIEAYATVDGSYTKFGEFTITVEPGDVIKKDIEAPAVHVSQPGGSEHICGSSVEVAGTATDESGVASITVNGGEVDFYPTGNPYDENEVSFSTTVGGLVVNEWNIITIVITDSLGNSVTVERRVFRDPCNMPPVITSITGPVDLVVIGEVYEITGVFTDPDDGDTHTATWDWGDGTTSEGTVNGYTVKDSHIYDDPGVYTVILTVVDSFGESDIEQATIQIWGPIDLKQDSICELENALIFDPEDDDIIEAIDYLHMSLGDERGQELGSEVVWGDPVHIDEHNGGYKGEDVFQYEQEAVDKLIAYIENDENEGTGVESIIYEVMEKLYIADKSLATTAIQDAIDAGGKEDDIKDAEDFLTEAEVYWSTSEYHVIADNVYDYLEKAWEKAVFSY